MARQATRLISARIEESLKQEFIRSAEVNNESPSDAMRKLVQHYIRETERELIRRDAAEIRANKEDEEDVMNWIAAHSVLYEDD